MTGGDMRKSVPLLVFAVAVLLLLGNLAPALAQEGDDVGNEGGNSLRLIVIIAAIWLAIIAAIVTMVVVTRRRSGEEDRESREG
jgi:heme/copper-type cytochrome/quinol oxidase subunit 2